MFQENTKLKPSTVYWKNLFNLNEASFAPGHRREVGKFKAALQKISSNARKEISSLEYISTEILKLQEYIIKVEEKQFNIISSFGYIQYPSISLSGIQLSLFDEGLIRLYHLLATVLILYFDASGSLILPLTRVRNKEGKENFDLPFDNASPFWKCASFSFI